MREISPGQHDGDKGMDIPPGPVAEAFGLIEAADEFLPLVKAFAGGYPVRAILFSQLGVKGSLYHSDPASGHEIFSQVRWLGIQGISRAAYLLARSSFSAAASPAAACSSVISGFLNRVNLSQTSSGHFPQWGSVFMVMQHS